MFFYQDIVKMDIKNILPRFLQALKPGGLCILIVVLSCVKIT